MKPIIFIPKGNFELTGEEMKALLDDIYEAGYRDGQAAGRSIIVTQPYNPWPRPYITWTCSTADAVTAPFSSTI